MLVTARLLLVLSLVLASSASAGSVTVLFGDKDGGPGVGPESDVDRNFGLDSFSNEFTGRSYTLTYDLPLGERPVSASVTVNAALLASVLNAYEASYNGIILGSLYDDAADLTGSVMPSTFDVPVTLLTGSDTFTLDRVIPEPADSFAIGGAVDFVELTVQTTPIIPTPAAFPAGLALLTLSLTRRRA